MIKSGFTIAFCSSMALAASSVLGQNAPVVSVKVVEGGESAAKAEDLRQVVVGPGINQPDPFPGYGGTVAWAGVARLKSGTLLVGISAGYWHASAPTPHVMSEAKLEFYRKIGMPRDVVAPTGGRIMFVRSDDNGQTWSKPQTLADTPADDRQAGLLGLPDGSVLCSWFTSFGEVDPWGDPALFSHTLISRSFDDGRPWEEPRTMQPQAHSPFNGEGTDGPPVLLKDGSILITSYGSLPASEHNKHTAIGVYHSTDRGATWTLLSQIKGDHDLDEPHTVELPDGRLVMMCRPPGEIAWSSDHGHTWTPLVSFGMPMAAPSLYVLHDGTLLCLYKDYYPHSGDRQYAIFSTNGGTTWIAPARDHGFLIDHAYGYGVGAPLPDGSVFVIYQKTGSHRTADAKSNALYEIRLRVRPDHSGIDLLPPVMEREQGRSLTK